MFFFFFKQKTAYEMRISDWSSDVCSSDLHHPGWDFAVNAPKSVSIMALVTGDELVVAAHEKAVGTALGWIEEHAQLRRRNAGEIVHETTEIGRASWRERVCQYV